MKNEKIVVITLFLAFVFTGCSVVKTQTTNSEGFNLQEENIIIYKIEYTVKYKKDGVGPQDSGKYIKWCTLIRKDKNSPWLIDEIG